MMNQEKSKRQVTLEDLLQLKRAERPRPEFWEKFERELRAKQLAAIVEKRPWWRAVPQKFAGAIRYRLPLGATAVLALTVLSVRQHQTISPSLRPASADVTIVPASTGEFSAVAATPSAPIEIDQVPSALAAERLATNSTASAVVIGAQESSEPENPSGTFIAASVSGEGSRTVPADLATDQLESFDLSPVARSIATNLAAAKEAHPELTDRFFGSVSGFEKRAMPATHQVVDPLSQMRNPADLHRERLLASAASTASVAVGKTGERIARRMISDERLTEEAISRFGARGDRVLVKF